MDGEPRMLDGVFVGHHERTGASLFITPNGVARGMGIHQTTPERRYDAKFLETCKGVPWALKPAQVTMDVPVGDASSVPTEEPMVVSLPVPKTRKMYVLKSDVEKFGGTDACQGCVSVNFKGSATVPHTEECRNRMLELLAREDDERARERVRHFKPSLIASARDEGRPDPAAQEVPAAEAAGAPAAEGDVAMDVPLLPAYLPGKASGSAGPTQEDILHARQTYRMDTSQARTGKRRDGRDEPEEHSGWEARTLDPRGEKREAAVGVQDMEEHIDSDVQVVLQPAAAATAATGTPGTGDATDTAMDADTSALSYKKAELVPIVETQLKEAMDLYRLEATEEDLKVMALCLCELSAVQISKKRKGQTVMKRMFNGYGLKPNIYLDLAGTDRLGRTWDLTRPEHCAEAERIRRKERPKVLMYTFPWGEGAGPEDAERKTRASVAIEEMVKSQLADGNDFLVEYRAGMRPVNLDFLTQARKEGKAFEVAGPTYEWVSKDDNKVHR